MKGIDSGTGGISRNRENVRNTSSTTPSGSSTWRRARCASSGERLRSHDATAAIGTQPTAIDTRNTESPIEPTNTGTTSAANERMHSPSSRNLKGSPSALNRCDSFATRISTITARRERHEQRGALEEEDGVQVQQAAEQEVHEEGAIAPVPPRRRGHRRRVGRRAVL